MQAKYNENSYHNVNCVMKKIICLLAVTSALVLAGCSKTNDSKAENQVAAPVVETWTLVKREPLEKLKVERDDMRDLVFYNHPTGEEFSKNDIYLYIVEDKSKALDLRLYLKYFGDDWLFVRKAWTKLDGNPVDLTNPLLDWRRDNTSGVVWETSDVWLKGEALKNIKRLAHSESPTIRFEGRDTYQDFKPSQKRLLAMREVIAAFEAAAGKEIK